MSLGWVSAHASQIIKLIIMYIYLLTRDAMVYIARACGHGIIWHGATHISEGVWYNKYYYTRYTSSLSVMHACRMLQTHCSDIHPYLHNQLHHGVHQFEYRQQGYVYLKYECLDENPEFFPNLAGGSCWSWCVHPLG